MNVFGRRILKYDDRIDLAGIDEIVFESADGDVVVSLYRARMDNEVDVRANSHTIAVHPRAANVVLVRIAK